MADDFDAIIGNLEEEFSELDTEGFDYSKFSNIVLVENIVRIRKDLMDRGVLIHPRTEEDMARQSVYYGLFWEARRRKLM